MSGALGSSIQFTAVEKNAAGDPVSGAAVTWTSSDSTIVAISASGLAINVGIGAATITATAGNSVSGVATQAVVGAAPISAVTVSPSQVSAGIEQTTRFTATLTDAAGNVLTGRRVLWQSSNPSVMHVDSTGTGTPLAAGAAVISAVSAGVTGSATAVVSSVVVQPPGAVADLIVVSTTDSSATVQFTQVSNVSGGTVSYDIRTSAPPIAFGAASSVTHGTCASPLAGTGSPGKLTCTVYGLAPATQFNVQLVAFAGTFNVNEVLGPLSNIAAGTTLPAVASVTLSPGVATTSVGSAGVQFTMVQKDAGGNVLANQLATWSSSNPAVATVSANGVASGVTAGTTAITATIGSVAATATLTVTAAVQVSTPGPAASVTVTPAAPASIVGPGTEQFVAVVKDAGGNVIPGAAVMWSSSNTGVATISSSGLATSVGSGTTTITATSGTVAGSSSLTVSTRSASTATPGSPPGTVSNLSVASTTDSSATLSFTQVADGLGGAANYDVRYAVAPITWGSANSSTAGTCTTPVVGTMAGSSLTCTVGGLAANTSYQFQLVSFRGTLNVNASFGSLSNVVSATTPAIGTGNGGSIAIMTQPGGATSGQLFTTQPVVQLRSASNALLTASSAPVTVSIVNGAGSLSGATTVNAAGGVATFTNLSLNGSGSITLQFSSPGFASTNAMTFTISQPAPPQSPPAATATALALATSPAAATSGTAFGTQPVVAVLGSAGGVLSSSTLAVTAKITSGSGTLAGTTTVTAVAGVATFTNLQITGTGSFVLSFSTASPALQVASSSFTVAAAPVVPPAAPPAGVAVVFQDGFESGDFTHTQNGVHWSEEDYVDVTSVIGHGGSHAARFREGTPGGSGSWAELDFDGLANLPEVYMQYYVYLPSGTESPSVGPKAIITGTKNDKFFRLWGRGPDGYDDGALNTAHPYGNKIGASTWGDGSGTDGHIGGEYEWSQPGSVAPNQWAMGEIGGGNGPGANQYYQFFQDANRGRWVQIRIHGKQASAANNDGVLQIWIDGVLRISWLALENGDIYGAGSPFGYTTGYLFGWANNGWPAGQMVYLDDFTITTGGFGAP